VRHVVKLSGLMPERENRAFPLRPHAPARFELHLEQDGLPGPLPEVSYFVPNFARCGNLERGDAAAADGEERSLAFDIGDLAEVAATGATSTATRQDPTADRTRDVSMAEVARKLSQATRPDGAVCQHPAEAPGPPAGQRHPAENADACSRCC